MKSASAYLQRKWDRMNAGLGFSLFSPAPPAELLEREGELEAIRELHRDAIFHGTGRKNHNYDDRTKGKPLEGIVDTLESVLTNGLLPYRDKITGIFLPGYDSTSSLTVNRPYARTYAQMFQEGEGRLSYEYGGRKFWVDQYLNSIAIEARKELFDEGAWRDILRNVLKNRESVRTLVMATLDGQENLTKTWLSNATKSFQSAERFSMTEISSDIAGNYPIMFGFDVGDIDYVDLPLRGLGMYERRTADVIGSDKIKFIETPELYIEETRKALVSSGFDHIPIIPMELGEVVSWEDGFAYCMRCEA